MTCYFFDLPGALFTIWVSKCVKVVVCFKYSQFARFLDCMIKSLSFCNAEKHKISCTVYLSEGVEGLDPEVPGLKYTRLLAEIAVQDGKIVASSTLRKLKQSDPLASLKGKGLGYTVYMNGRAPLTVLEFNDGPTETATAVINDLLLL